MPENITWPPIGGDTYPIPKSGETNWPSLTNFLTALRNAQGTKAQKVASRTATSSPVTVSQAEDHTIIINLTAPGPCVVNLPAGIPGQVFAICDGSGLAGANPITVTPNGSELIQGQSEMLINQNYAAVIIGFDEVSQWRVLALAAGEGTGGGVSRSTLDAGNPNYVIINGIDGKLSEEQRLATVRGGLGIDASALNGYLKFVSGTASAGGIDAADIPSGIDAAKISSGAVSNTVFNFLVGVTSSIQTQLDSKLPSNQQLVNLSSTITNLTTSGFVAENGIGLFEKRQIAAGSSKVSISNPAGIAGNPTIDVSEANLTLDNLGGTLSISKGGTGQTTAAAAAAALLPLQSGQSGKVLGTDGSALSWVAGGGSGGLTPVAVSSTGTCTANTVELCNVAGGTITRTLPSLPAGGADAISILILDNGSASNTKKITIAPASGQTISGYAANDTVSINYAGGWVALYAEPGAANWEIQTSASTAVPPATPSSDGVNKKPRYQTKYLAANVTTNGATALSFSGLIVGRTYRITANVGATRGSNDGKALLAVMHNGVNLAFAGLDDDGTVVSPPTRSLGHVASIPFVAATTTLTLVATLAGTNSTILGGGTVTPTTFATLEELNHYEATTDFT